MNNALAAVDDFYIRRGLGPASAARVTVLTRGRPTAPIAVSELAEIVKGRNPKHRRLLEPKAGFWVRVGFRYPSPVLSLDQQFQP